MLGPMMAILLWIGLYPQPILDTFRPSLAAIQQDAPLKEAVRR